MKHPLDNKTILLICLIALICLCALASGSESKNFVLGNSIKKRSRTSTDDVKGWLQMSKRSAQRYLKNFVQIGLLYAKRGEGLENRYYLSGKAKQLFEVKG